MAWTPRGSVAGDAGGGAGPQLPIAFGLPRAPKTGRWYGFPSLGTISVVPLATSSLYATPFAVQAACTPASFTIYVTTAGSTIRGALYRLDSGLEPAAFAYDLGSVSASTNGVRSFTASLPQLTTGWWAFALAPVGAASGVRAATGTFGQLTPAYGAAPTTLLSGTGYVRDGISLGADAWPTEFGATATAALGCRVDVGF
jgi:hypothetical protein